MDGAAVGGGGVFCTITSMAGRPCWRDISHMVSFVFIFESRGLQARGSGRLGDETFCEGGTTFISKHYIPDLAAHLRYEL